MERGFWDFGILDKICVQSADIGVHLRQIIFIEKKLIGEKIWKTKL